MVRSVIAIANEITVVVVHIGQHAICNNISTTRICDRNGLQCLVRRDNVLYYKLSNSNITIKRKYLRYLTVPLGAL